MLRLLDRVFYIKSGKTGVRPSLQRSNSKYVSCKYGRILILICSQHTKAYLNVFVSTNTMAYFIFFENMIKYDLTYLIFQSTSKQAYLGVFKGWKQHKCTFQHIVTYIKIIIHNNTNFGIIIGAYFIFRTFKGNKFLKNTPYLKVRVRFCRIRLGKRQIHSYLVRELGFQLKLTTSNGAAVTHVSLVFVL